MRELQKILYYQKIHHNNVCGWIRSYSRVLISGRAERSILNQEELQTKFGEEWLEWGARREHSYDVNSMILSVLFG